MYSEKGDPFCFPRLLLRKLQICGSAPIQNLYIDFCPKDGGSFRGSLRAYGFAAFFAAMKNGSEDHPYADTDNEEYPAGGGHLAQNYIQYILDTYSQTLIRLCYTYVHNICDAEDITQDVFVALLKRGRPFDSAEHEKAWLLRTAINKSKNYLRSGWVKRTVPLNDNDEAETDDSMEEKNQVMEAVLSLPEKYRTVIHLFYYNGYSINEISAIVGKKAATVGTLLARGRNMLKEMMIGGFDEDE